MGRKVFSWSIPKRTKEKDVDQDKTHSWLSTPGLKSETEGFIIAALLRPTTTETRSWKMALTQCAEFVGNFKKQLTTLSPDALNLPRQSTYKDTIKLQHISTGQYASTTTSKINTTNMNQLLWQKTKQQLYFGTCQSKPTKR